MTSSFVFLLVCSLPVVIYAWWPFSSEAKEPSPGQASPTHAAKAASFEMATAEQKFLSEAQQLLDLAPLDRCLHGVSCKRDEMNFLMSHT